MVAQMEYRQDTPQSHGYENESDEYEDTRQQIQMLVSHSSPDEVCDMLLVLSNICEYRALMANPDPKTQTWYTAVQELCREMLSVLDSIPDGPRPNIKLENHSLYWPDSNKTH